MTTKSWFWDSVAGDRLYTSADFASLESKFATDGYINGFANEFAITDHGADMQLNVGTGAAWIQGRAFEVTAIEAVAFGAADPALPRIDRIVMRADYANRQIVLAVKAGVPNAAPVPPALTRNAGVTWELSIGQVLVGAAALNIDPANYTSELNDPTVCGRSTGPRFFLEALTTAQRNALAGANALYTGRMIYNTTTAQVEVYNGAGWVKVNNTVDIQTFTASGTWNKPAGGVVTEALVWGAGGGGGGGGGSLAGADAGGGGGGGAFNRRKMLTADLGATEAVTVGAGGTSGAGAVAAGNGSVGGQGGNSSFGSWVTAYGGGPGGGATATEAGGGGGGGLLSAGLAGANVSPSATVGAGGQPAPGAPVTNNPPTASSMGGGVGGDINGNSATSGAGGASIYGGGGGGACLRLTQSGHGGDSSFGGGGGGGGGELANNLNAGNGGNNGGVGGANQNGTAGAAGASKFKGGGGGGINTAGVGGAGGAGGVAAGGGGGGKGSTNGGAGGVGGRGEVVVITYF